MPTGVVLDPDRSSANHVAAAIDQARRAYNAGVRQLWIAQQFDHDAISLAGYVGAAVPGLAVGTFVVPINPRHPLTLASQALTAQAATGGNFSLGLGLGAHAPEQVAFGTAWPNTIGRLREHLQILRSILDTGTVDFHGEEFTAAPQWPVTVAGGTPLPVYVAAMGPKALRVTGNWRTARCLISQGRAPSRNSSCRPSPQQPPRPAGAHRRSLPRYPFW